MTGGMTLGILLILASFGVLVIGSPADTLRSRGSRLARLGYVYGIVSALGYASGYLLRKMGLAEAHDALLGAAVGCLVGVLLFLATAALNESPMSRVALIQSMEVFVTLFLGYAFLRTRETLTPALAVAALLGVSGAAFIVGL